MNHRVIEQAPGDGQVQGLHAAGVLSTLDANTGSIGQEQLPASPDPMQMDQLHGAPNNDRSANAPTMPRNFRSTGGASRCRI